MIPKIILSKIAESESFLLFCHSRPDGDAIGSLFGLALMLENSGCEVHCFLEEEVPSTFTFLHKPQNIYIGSNGLDNFINDNGSNYLGIALDCGDKDRLGSFSEGFDQLPETIVIDHHKSHVPFGLHHWVKSDASSTGELVYEIGAKLGRNISLPVANALYVAIATDTGSFIYSSTSKRTHEIAGILIEAGVRPENIAANLYDNWSLPRLELMKDVLSTLSVTSDGKVASIYVTQEMLSRHNTTSEDTESFVDYPRSLQSVEVAIFVKETKSDDLSVSFRAKGNCDVSLIAEQFSGGGHANAAGCKINCSSAEEAVKTAVKAVQAVL